jgi:pimeloyl-ACP methyl ester carboxylesterase
MDTAASSLWIDRATNLQRDVILFDPRGVGQSQPRLNCPELTPNLYFAAQLTPQRGDENYVDVLLACRARLLDEDIDLTAYTTVQTAADVRDIRIALGYEQINLWGNSYGTYLALVAMRDDYPDSIRSVVLDGVVTPGFNMITGLIERQSESLQGLFERCAADSACSTAYPNLAQTFNAVLTNLNVQPAHVTVTNPFTSVSEEVMLDGAGFALQLFEVSSVTWFVGDLPYIIAAAHDGNLQPFLETVSPSLYYWASIDYGQRYSVLCETEILFTSELNTSSMAESLPAPIREGITAKVEADLQLCRAWGMFPATTLEIAPVTSDIPTLLLSGELDPFTPPVFAEYAARTLSTSYRFSFPGIAHGAATASPCALSILDAFILDPNAPPADSCIVQMAAPAFKLR